MATAGTTRTKTQLIGASGDAGDFADNAAKAILALQMRNLVMSCALKWRTVTTQTTTYAITVADDMVIGNHATVAFTITLPTAVGITGQIFRLKNINAAVVTVAATSSQTIDGQTTRAMEQWQSLTVISDGANWILI